MNLNMSHAPVNGGLIPGIVPSSVSTGKQCITYLSILSHPIVAPFFAESARIYLNRERSALRIAPAVI